MARRSEDLAYLNQNISLALFLLYGDDFNCSCNTELKSLTGKYRAGGSPVTDSGYKDERVTRPEWNATDAHDYC
jgi:hypothetical protein